MSWIEPYLLLLCFLIWASLLVLLILNHAVYDVRRRYVRASRRKLRNPALQTSRTEEPVRRVRMILARLPLGTISRVASTVSMPDWTSKVFAKYAIERWGVERFVKDAAQHRGEISKWRRVAASHILSNGGYADILTLLRNAVFDADSNVAGAAVNILGKMPDTAAAQLLIEALRAQAYSPSRIATALDNFPLPISELLRPLLKDAQPTSRYWAAQLLARYAGTKEAGSWSAELARLVDDVEPNVRKAAVQTLGKIGGAHAAVDSLKLLGDPVWYAKERAARELYVKESRR